MPVRVPRLNDDLGHVLHAQQLGHEDKVSSSHSMLNRSPQVQLYEGPKTLM